MAQERTEDLLSIKQGYLVILFLIAIDLVSKFVAEENLVFGEAIPLIPILDLLLVFNSGIAFSIFDFNNNAFSFGLSLFGLVIVAYLHSLYKTEESSIYRLSLILIIAGSFWVSSHILCKRKKKNVKILFLLIIMGHLLIRRRQYYGGRSTHGPWAMFALLSVHCSIWVLR